MLTLGDPLSRRIGVPAACLLLVAVGAAPAQMTPDQQAEMILNGARRAYNERNYPFATARFREFLQKFAAHRDAPSARYGLALCLIDGPDRNLAEALQLFQPLGADKSFADHPHALYQTAHCQRALGLRELTEAAAKPAEAVQRRAEARKRFDEAGRTYAAAVAEFSALVKTEPLPSELPPEAEWAARARCDQAEMLLRTDKRKEARDTVAPFLTDPVLVRSRYRRLALYHHGFASFLLEDRLAAGRSLNQLTPFADPGFGTHANYLLARVHHIEGERAEAENHYRNVLARHEEEVREAREILKNPQALRDEPDERARLQALATGPTPDHLTRTLLYLGVLNYEDGKFGEALTRFTELDKQAPASPLAAEVRLRIGFCQVQLKQHADALKTLLPLVDSAPDLADQALLWMGKAQSGAADPANADAFVKAQAAAVETLRRAAEKAKGDAAEVKARRGTILLELADVQQLARQFKESAATLNQILAEKVLAEREEEVNQRLVTALHLAGEYDASDAACVRFQAAFPKSTLLPDILFRHAENAAFAGLAAERNLQLADRVNVVKRHNDEAIKRYQALVERFPEHPQVNLAKHGLATGHYRKGDIEKARDLFESIPAAERIGDLATVPYVLADCHIRLAPESADDALAAGMLTDAMTKAIEALSAFVGASPQAAQTPDALLKLGHCHVRMAEIHALPAERQKSLTAARAAYEQVTQKFPQHPLRPQAVFERARVLALQGDINGAINELRRFAAAPDAASPIAPMALLRLATLLRSQNKSAEAVDVLAKCRQAHESALAQDAQRSGWVALLQYHHGIALREAGKLPEALQTFDGIVKNHATRPEAAEAALRYGQTLKEEARLRIDAVQKTINQPGRTPAQVAEDRKKLDEGVKMLGDAVKYLESAAVALKAQKPDLPGRALMFYDAAWAARDLADLEVTAAREKLRQERWQKLKDEAAKNLQPGRQPPFLPAPEVPLSAVPLQESEKKLRALYQTMLAEFPDLEQSIDARFELAELLSEREEHDAAVKLLNDAFDREPSPELTEKIRLRLGACLMAIGDTTAALAQFGAVARNEKSPLRAQAVYRAGECHLHLSDPASAEKELRLFRDLPAFHNVPGVSDRALLRLGHALAELKQWDASRQAFEQMLGRFPQSLWIHEARYGAGWAHQSKGEFDQAVNQYTQVTNSVATELGAKAQLNIGLCRLAQKRYPEASTALLVVPFTYDYPELSAVALLEAARALAENNQREQAIRLLERLLRDHPDGEPAKAARERLEGLRKS